MSNDVSSHKAPVFIRAAIDIHYSAQHPNALR